MSTKLALSIGNSRYHWAWLSDITNSWDTDRIEVADLEKLALMSDLECRDWLFDRYLDRIISAANLDRIEIKLASVVKQHTAIWTRLPQVRHIELADISIANLYPTLGIDRALVALGGGETYGYPILAIDGGTALTLTGIDAEKSFVGGAILPGVRLQFRSLSSGTAALPNSMALDRWPPRWARDTETAIASGILHAIGAGVAGFIHDWRDRFPDSVVVITGGDGELIYRYLQQINISNLMCDRHVIFRGMLGIN
jgi:type III pantothenate kinase